MRRLPFLLLPLLLLLAGPDWAGVAAPDPFAAAVSQLRARLSAASSLPAVRRAALRHALADAEFAWAQDLLAHSRPQSALDHYQAAYALDKGDRLKQSGNDLNNMGVAYLALSQPAKAIDFFQQALPLYRQEGNTDGQASILTNLGNAYNALSQPAKAIDFSQQALPLYRQEGNTDGEAKDLMNLGNVYLALSQPAKAIDFFQQALPLFVKAGDKHRQANDLGNLGNAYLALSQPAKAIDFYQQALPLYRQAGDADGQASDLNNMGIAYNALSQPAKAIDFYQQALPLFVKAGDRTGQASDLNNLGNAYNALSQPAKAIDFFQQALPLLQQAGNTDGQAGDLTNLGNAYNHLSQPAKAIDFFQQALPLFVKAGDTDGQAKDLNNLGNAYNALSEYAKAIDFYEQALPLYRQAGDADGQAGDLNNMGIAYGVLSQPTKAIDFFQRALPLLQQAGDRTGQAKDLNNLMLVSQSQHSPRLAIFYGKQSVNVYQSIRAGLHTLDKQTQKTYLASVTGTYRRLVDLLIEEDRLPEAEQVLAMLKDEEVTDFVRRDAALTPEALSIVFSPEERSADADCQKYADPVTSLGRQIEALDAQMAALPKGSPLKIPLGTQEVSLQDQLGKAQDTFKTFQADQLPKELSARAVLPPGKNDPAQVALQEHSGIQSALAAMEPGTVALLTIVEPDKYRVIVVTSKTEKAEEYPIDAVALRKLVLKWREALSDPRLDPRPLGERLSQILIGPIAQDLIGARAHTLLWSLDGVLRYVPIAALYSGGHVLPGHYDPAGGHYLVEKYRVAVFTGAGLPSAAAAPADWGADSAVAALGVTRQQTIPDPHGGAPLFFPPLTGVDRELKAIDRYDGNPGGALRGDTPLEDDAFSLAAFRLALTLKPAVVHIASHFYLGSDDTDSFLLLGGGKLLTLHDLYHGSGGQVFQGVDLLTLSACQTAEVKAGRDGHEVESLATVSQSQGASSILASLWPVSDAATPLLMGRFYHLRASSPGSSKAEALRQAQLSLLHGDDVLPAPALPGAAPRPLAVRGIERSGDIPDPDLPAYVPDPKAPYSHPYFWSAFVLIGNWK